MDRKILSTESTFKFKVMLIPELPIWMVHFGPEKFQISSVFKPFKYHKTLKQFFLIFFVLLGLLYTNIFWFVSGFRGLRGVFLNRKIIRTSIKNLSSKFSKFFHQFTFIVFFILSFITEKIGNFSQFSFFILALFHGFDKFFGQCVFVFWNGFQNFYHGIRV